MEECWGWQQSTKDNADALSLVHLVPDSALHSRKEPAGLLLLCYQGADKDREVEEERGGGGRAAAGCHWAGKRQRAATMSGGSAGAPTATMGGQRERGEEAWETGVPNIGGRVN